MIKRSIAGAFALALLFGACGGDDDGGAIVQEGSEKPAAEAFTITATDYAFEAPAEIEGGAVTLEFINKGAHAHEAVVLEVGDTPADKAAKDFEAVLQGGPFPDYMDVYGGGPSTPAGATSKSTFTLPEGEYLLICALSDETEGDTEAPAHVTLGMHRPLSVKGDNGAKMPAGDGTIAIKDYSFTMPEMKAGKHTYVVRNDGPEQIHFADFMVFPAGVDEAAAAEAWGTMMSLEEDAAPPDGLPMPEPVGTSAAYSPGQSGTYDLDLEAGRTYVVACFISDRAGGPPHAIGHQMIGFFTVK